MIKDFEAAEELLPKNNNQFVQRKQRTKIYSTHIDNRVQADSIFKKLNDGSNPKQEKDSNKFVFKVYLHILGQAIVIFIMLFFSFRNQFVHTLLIENKLVFYIILIILLIAFIQALIFDDVLKHRPQNYFFLVIFTFCFSYCLCKQAIFFDFYLIMIMSILNIVEILYLMIESYIVTTNEKKGEDIANTATFMGLTLLIIGGILCFLKKISVIHFSMVLIILIILGIYIIYDMNCIFLDKRKHFSSNGYVLATVFLYVDIFQTALELLEKFYNSCEPERKQKRNVRGKSMIYTGDEDYDKLYENQEEKQKKRSEDDFNLNHVRRNSSSNIKRNVALSNVIQEAINEEEEKENNEDEEKGNDEKSIDEESDQNKENDGDKEDKEGNEDEE